MPLQSWKLAYPAPARRPTRDKLPPWSKLPVDDLRMALVRSGVPLRSVRNIVELGAGDCMRLMHALKSIRALNRRELRVTCVDLAPRAIYWGLDEWARLSLGLTRGRVRPRWSMRFIAADALSVPVEQIGSPDILIDWMMFHGMSDPELVRYRRLIRKLRPRYLLLKCFAEPGPRGAKMQAAIRGVQKRRWTESQIHAFFGDQFEPLAPSRYCRENMGVDDGDGPRQAKREYILVDRGVSGVQHARRSK